MLNNCFIYNKLDAQGLVYTTGKLLEKMWKEVYPQLQNMLAGTYTSAAVSGSAINTKEGEGDRSRRRQKLEQRRLQRLTWTSLEAKRGITEAGTEMHTVSCGRMRT